jgi:hypothetical protein
VAVLAQIAGHALARWLHGLLALGPSGGADFAVLLEVLEGVDRAQGFIDDAPEV